MPSSPISRPPTAPGAALLAVVAVLAATLRLTHLTERGLFFWDEAKFALEGIRMERALESAVGMTVSLADGKPVGSAKPGHALLIGISYAIAGIHDYSPLLMNASCSIAACVLLAVLGWRLFGQAVGIVAGFLLAVSEYDVLYARSALSESDATLIFLIGVTVWLWSVPATGTPARGRRLWVCAIVLGAAFSTNYRLIVYVGVVVLADLFWGLRRDGRGVIPARALLWSSGLLAVPAAWLVAGLLASSEGLTLFFNEITARRATYAAEVVYQLHQGKQSVVRFAPLIYGAWYVNRDGIAASIALAVGLLWCALRPMFVRVAVAALVVLPYAAYTFAPFIVPRNMVAALPFAALVSALGLVDTARWRPPAGGPLVAITMVTLGLTVIGASMSWRLTEHRSGFAAAAAAIDRRGGRALTSTEVMVFYLRRPGGACNAPAVPLSLRMLAADRRAGYRLVVLEPHHNSPITAYIAAHGRLIGEWPAFAGPNLGESPVASENGTWPNPHAKPENVYLYDISTLRLPSPGNARAQICRLRVPA